MKKFKYILLALCTAPLFGSAQQARLNLGAKLHDNLAYADAIEVYENIAQGKADSSEVAENLAHSYWEMRDMDKAAEWYGIACEGQEVKTESWFYYAESLKSCARYPEAEEAMMNYNQRKADDSRARAMLDAPGYAETLKANPEKFNMQNLNINTSKSDFGAGIWKDQFYFASSRKEGVGMKKTFRWNNAPFLDLYSSKHVMMESVGEVKCLNKAVNSNYHEGSCSFDPDGKVMYFTRNNHHQGKTGKTSKDVINLKMYRAEMTDAGWGNVEAFAFNSEEYSVGHPSVTMDGMTMYFASDMPGGEGGVDIYKCTRTSMDAAWSEPVNLGSGINTEGDEMFPFIHEDGTLYVVSDGHLGLGGLDVFEAKANGAGFDFPENLGFPLNTEKDDFAFILNSDKTRGFVSSNRNGGMGDDDIYAFTMEAIPSWNMTGTVVEMNTNAPIEGARVVLYDGEGNLLQESIMEADGAFNFDLDPEECDYRVEASNGEGWTQILSNSTPCDKRKGMFNVGSLPLEEVKWGAIGTVKEKGTLAPLSDITVTLYDKRTGGQLPKLTDANGSVNYVLSEDTDYGIRFEKEGYFAKTGEFSTVDMEPGIIEINKYVDLLFEKIVLNKGIKIENIYYDYDKSFIRKDAAVELDKIYQLLIDNPTLKIEMGSHTDARGSDAYNKSLSERRAKSAMEYLIKKGISKERVTKAGYGETVLVNQCANGVKCDNETHEENRRTEFKVLEF